MCTVWDVVSGVAQAVNAAFEWREIAITKAEAKYKAETLMKEANTAKEQAGVERQEGIEEARESRLKSILKMGEIKTDTAAGNISVSSQNTLNLMETEKLNGELEALNSIEEANKLSDSYLDKAYKLTSQAQLLSAHAKDKSAYFKLGAKTTAQLTDTAYRGWERKKKRDAEKKLLEKQNNNSLTNESKGKKWINWL